MTLDSVTPVGLRLQARPGSFIPLANPAIGPIEEAEVISVLRSGRLAMGPKAEEFEGRLAAYTGMPWAAAVSSGTAGLHLAVRALGIGPGDCVVTTSFSFIASSNCIRYEGAEPVFVDIDPETLCLSPDALSSYLDTCRSTRGVLEDPVTRRRVAAVLAVDVFGHPADWPRIVALARDRGLALIADSCEAFGSTYRARDGEWRHAGSEADLAVIAFYPNKQVTTGEGGAVLGSDPVLLERIRSLRNQGRAQGDPWLRHQEIGFNFRMNELSAAVGVAQMRRVDEILARRQAVAARYDRALVDVDGLRLPHAAEWAAPEWFVYFVRADSRSKRDALLKWLMACGIEAKGYFDPPIHRQRHYRDAPMAGPLPATEQAAARTLIVPFFAALHPDQVDAVADSLIRGLARARRIRVR